MSRVEPPIVKNAYKIHENFDGHFVILENSTTKWFVTSMNLHPLIFCTYVYGIQKMHIAKTLLQVYQSRR